MWQDKLLDAPFFQAYDMRQGTIPGITNGDAWLELPSSGLLAKFCNELIQECY